MNDVYAIAIHGGAGDESKPQTEAERAPFLEALRTALKTGQEILAKGGSATDAVLAAIVSLEDNSLFNAGRGAAYTHEGKHELDASIMDGSDFSVGAVAGVKTVKNPIRLAHLVRRKTPYVLLTGEGAEAFAREMGVDLVENSYFDDPVRYEQWQKKLAEEKTEKGGGGIRGTVGAVALDRHGNLCAAASTGGLTDTHPGRVGDTPLIGAGVYADNAVCAVACTGTGEQFVRYAVAHDVYRLMSYRQLTLQQAAEEVIHHGNLKPDDGGLIAVDAQGKIALVFNTEQMFRGAADHTGRFEVAI